MHPRAVCSPRLSGPHTPGGAQNSVLRIQAQAHAQLSAAPAAKNKSQAKGSCDTNTCALRHVHGAVHQDMRPVGLYPLPRLLTGKRLQLRRPTVAAHDHDCVVHPNGVGVPPHQGMREVHRASRALEELSIRQDQLYRRLIPIYALGCVGVKNSSSSHSVCLRSSTPASGLDQATPSQTQSC